MSNAVRSIRVDASRRLEYAVIEASPMPVVLLGSRLRVVVASTSFCDDYEISGANIYGRPFTHLGAGEWNVPGLSRLLTEMVAGFSKGGCFNLELIRRDHLTRNLVINAKPLGYDDDDRVRIAIFILDKTEKTRADQRVKDVIKEKETLLEGVHRRVATSLQIVAIMLARNTSTEKAGKSRDHLYDAKQRVMSLAAIEQQLAPAKEGAIEIRPYLNSLCASIDVSILPNPRSISLEVLADDGVISVGASIAIGVIVTELVLNAVVRAFASDTGNTIRVEYKSRGPNWKLSVSDDGAGARDGSRKESFGMRLVETVAKTQEAKMSIVADASGTTVSLSHTHAHVLSRQFIALGGRLI